MSSLGRLWNRLDFRRLLIGQGISGLGDWMATFALMALAWEITSSTAAVGGILTLRLLPAVLGGALSTRIAARWDRRRTMLAMDALRAAMVAVVPLVASLWWIYLWAFLLEAASVVFLSARDAAIPELAERTVVINGMSKAYAMTGWRLGWLAGPTELISVAGMFNSQTATAAATFTQHAAVAALNGPQDCVERMRQSYEERRDFMVSAFNRIPNMSCPNIEGAFYAFPKVDETKKTSAEIANIILSEAMVVGVPGQAFGATKNAHIRFSFAEDFDLLREAVARIQSIADKLA